MRLAVSGARTQREGALRRKVIVLAAFAASVVLFGGARLSSAWYNNLGSLALSEEWPVVTEAPSVPRCQQWAWGLASAAPVARALRLDPLNARARFNSGRVAWLSGDCEMALDAWSNSSPADVIARLEWANGLYALGRKEEAVALFRKMNDAAGYFRWRGEQVETTPGSSVAREWYELSMTISPTLMTAHYLAQMHVESQDADAAWGVWREVVEATGEFEPDHWWALGQSAELREQWRAAAVAYERGAEEGGNPCSFLERQAASLQRLEEWVGAEGLSRQALTRCPNEEWPYLQLGNLRRQQGDDAGALLWYRQAEARWPDDVYPKHSIGLNLYEQGDYEQAKAYFLRALAIEPCNVESLYYLGWCFYRSDDLEQAVVILANAIELHGAKPWHWAVTLGDWQRERGAWEEAITAYQKALAWQPGETTIRQRLESAMSFRQ